MKNKKNVALGSALIDVLIHTNNDFLKKIGGQKGGMTYVDSNFIDEIIAKSSEKPIISPGGSVCNTISGLGMLGANAFFIGKKGECDFGKYFEEGLKKRNVNSILSNSNNPTGKVLSVITPDAQRTMFTYLGASSEMSEIDIISKKEYFLDADFILLEGYLLFNESLILKAIEIAKLSSASVVMDLSSFTVVEQKKDFIKKKIMPFIDVLIANEDEAYYYTGHKEAKKAIKVFSKEVPIAVINLGKKGSLISYHGEIFEIKANQINNLVDTTGAGDLWISGFLFGLLNNYSIKKSGKLATACASYVCQITGTNISSDVWEKIKKEFKI